MSDQDQNIEPNDTPNNEPQYSAVEQEAMAQGWRPKEEFDGEPERFIDAGEFLRRGELFAKIDHQNKELKQVRSALEQFKLHHSNVEKVAYDRAIADLKKQRKNAFAEGDVDQYEQIDDQIDSLKEERDQFVAQQAQQVKVPEVNPEFSAWVSRNQWYAKDTIMQGAADRFGMQLAKEGLPPLEVLKRVEAEIKKEFPHKFSNPNREKPSNVEASTPRGNANKSRFVPTEDQKRIGMTFVRQKLYKNVDEYYAELEQMEKGK